MSYRGLARMGGSIHHPLELIEVEIGRDGALTILDAERDYKVAFAAMAGDLSNIQLLEELWVADPMHAIMYALDIPFDAKLRLAADYVEHTLYGYEARRGSLVLRALGSVRRYADGRSNLKTLDAMYQRILKQETPAAKAAMYLLTHHGHTNHNVALWCAASDVCVSKGGLVPTSRSESEIAEELAWQVRRFVDTMEALQAGKKWPPMEATQ